MFKRAIISALSAFLAIRIVTSLTIVIAGLFFQPNPPPAPYDPAIVQDLASRGEISRLFLAPWYRWDTVHYLQIAEQGYSAHLENTVWPPLYPELIRLFALVFQPPMLAAIVVANLAAIVALFLLYWIVSDTWGEQVGRHVMVWTVIFPSGFFLLAGYTESLFLALALATLLAARKHEWWLAGAMGALATMTRLQAVALALPVLWEGYKYIRPCRGRDLYYRAANVLAATALMPAALAGFSLFVHFRLGADWPWNTLSANWHLHWALPWTGIIGTLQAMSHSFTDLNQVSRFFDVCLTLWFVFLLIYGLRRLPVTYTLFSLVLFLPAITKILDNNTLMSVSRYLLPIFPLFVVQDFVTHPRSARIFIALCMLAGQVLLVYMFYRWVWVA